jgi:hypothetical protein
MTYRTLGHYPHAGRCLGESERLDMWVYQLSLEYLYHANESRRTTMKRKFTHDLEFEIVLGNWQGQQGVYEGHDFGLQSLF